MATTLREIFARVLEDNIDMDEKIYEVSDLIQLLEDEDLIDDLKEITSNE